MNSQKASSLQRMAKKVRAQILQISKMGRAPHLGSAFSCVDLILAAYNSFLNISFETANDPSRDRFILSKGHAASALYVVLAECGFFPQKLLETFNQNGSCLPEHPSLNCVLGVEASTGSLGHGLSMAAGLALGARLLEKSYRVMVLLSDGECNEGSVWEAALFAAAQRLSNLIVIVDFNKWQATGRSEEILAISPLAEKWKAFGWTTYSLDGHDFSQILSTFETLSQKQEGPVCLIADTVKGKGVSFMEDDNNWHYRIPNEEEYALAQEELRSS